VLDGRGVALHVAARGEGLLGEVAAGVAVEGGLDDAFPLLGAALAAAGADELDVDAAQIDLSDDEFAALTKAAQ
jgi:hypothetical protein